MLKRYLLASLLFFNLPILQALSEFYQKHDYIKNFSSIIKILNDRSLDITENIEVVTTGQVIKRGIVREFPTKYKDRLGNKFNTSFELKEVLLNNKPVNYKVEDYQNGKIVYVGDKNIFLSPGEYTYTIKYKTDNQLGFYKDHDELYFNVNGNGWRLPIENIEATIILPDSIQENKLGDKITYEAYTGSFGSQEKNYQAYKEGHKIIFKTTKSSDKLEGLTVVVTWPKGYIKEPTLFEKFIKFIKDNLYILFLLLGLLFLIPYCIYVRLKTRVNSGTIIPLFYPPEDLSAGSVRYIYKMGYDAKTFAAQIVQMAVSGLFKINYKSGFFPFSAGSYSLETDKIEKKSEKLENRRESKIESKYKEDKLIFEKLFSDNQDNVNLSKQNPKLISSNNIFDNFLKNNFEYKYFDYHADNIVWVVILSIFFCFIPLVFLGITTSFSPLVFVLIFLYFLVNIIFAISLKGYTKEGRKIADQIEGFKMFLKATEESRLKVIGTPPTKTPELYEKYLPYAIALDCEEQWSKKFAPIFANLAAQGHPYQSQWAYGFNPILLPTSFSNSFASSVASASSPLISSSSYAPGTFSGSGGRGSSGGGGGGGGGGGW